MKNELIFILKDYIEFHFKSKDNFNNLFVYFILRIQLTFVRFDNTLSNKLIFKRKSHTGRYFKNKD